MKRHAKAPSVGSSKRQGMGRLAFGALAIALLVSVAIVASAGASKGVLSFFGSEGAGDGQFGNFPGGTNVAAVNSTGNGSGASPGDVYVIDNADKRIEQFDSDGNFIRAFGWGVQDGSNAFQVCAAGCQAGVAPGAPGAAGALPNARGIAIDQATGNLFVSDQADHRISAYGSDGSFQGAFGYGVAGGAEFQFCASGCSQGTAGAAAGQLGSALGALAVDPSGNVLVADRTNRRIDRFSVATTAGTVTGAAFIDAVGWDVDPAGLTDEFEVCTVATTCRAGQVEGDESLAGKFTFNLPTALAVDSTGAIYASNGTGSEANPRRVEKLTPSGESFTPSTFAPAQLSGAAILEGIATTAEDRVLVARNFDAGATPSCPDGKPSLEERRILELNSAGTELKDTHIACARITSVNGLAVNTTTKRIYVPSNSGGKRVYVIDEVAPPIVSIDPVTDQTATTATFSGEVNPNGLSTGYRFEYSSDGGATWTPTASPNIDLGSGASAIDVESARQGLSPNTTYQVRLVAVHPFNAGPAITAPISFTTGTAPPTISTAASVAGEEAADLHSIVNPQGSNVTDCHFEWGTTTSYGNSAPCASLPGSGVKPQLVSAHLGGLASGTTYHYRLIAGSAAGAATGPDRAIEVGGALPDNRAWEMVSPPDKNGGNVMVNTRRTRAAAGLSPGEPMAFAFASLQGFAGAEGAGVSFDYLAVRGPGRWQTHAIAPRQDPVSLGSAAAGADPLYEGELSADLSRGIYRASPTRDLITPDSGPVSKVQNLYLRSDLRDPGPGSYSLQTACPRCLEAPATALKTDDQYKPTFTDATDDFRHVTFESTRPLTKDAAEAQPLCAPFGFCQSNAYESVDGAVRLVGRVPVSGDRCDDEAGPACEPAASSGIGEGIGFYRVNTVSSDGSRVLFRTPAGGEPQGQLYVRFGGHATVRVNASEKTVPDETKPAEFTVALSTPDLSHVFFSTAEQLVESDEDQCSDLYRYDTAPLGPDGLPDPGASHLTRISVDEEPADGTCAGAGGVAAGAVGFSDDGETVYFLTRGPGAQLVPGAPLNDSRSILYVWHDGRTRYVAMLNDFGSVDAQEAVAEGGIPVSYTARVTPDGSHLLFPSYDGKFLTGYDHGSACAGSVLPACRELYLYDADANGGAGEVACVSCVPDGAPASRSPSLDDRVATGGANTTDHINHPLSDDGRYVFFTSPERLVPTDTNGKRDVYRYDSVNGDLKLISSGGEDAGDSYFLDASPDGKDAFFATAAQLSGWDVDQAYDAYDARVGGGLPEPPAPVPSCLGDACQPAPRSLNDPTPSSSTFQGAGNPKARKPRSRCPKGRRAVKARGKTRCVRRNANRRHHKRNANNHRRTSR